MFECTCPLCQEGKYKGEDYYVDMSFLKKSASSWRIRIVACKK